MMSKPALGFKSRTQAAVALQAEGFGTAEIGRRLGISQSAASGLLSSYNRGTRSEERSRARPETHFFPVDVRMQLRGPAVARGVSVDRLIADVIAVVAADGLVDAILDDRRSTQ